MKIFEAEKMDEPKWEDLLEAVREISEMFPDVTFIGGIAVYAHLINDKEYAEYAAQSTDADFMILTQDYADLRDLEVLTPNRRLSKQQFVKNGFEFDVYVENQHGLPVPTDEVYKHSIERFNIRIACHEHLLILKAEAMKDRRNSRKGDKDEDDIVRILISMKEVNEERLAYMGDQHMEMITGALNGRSTVRMARGNLHLARKLKDMAQQKFSEVRQTYERSINKPPVP